jgi:hypothetical protein
LKSNPDGLEVNVLRRPMNPSWYRPDDSRQKTFTRHLNIYYDALIGSIHDAESILIFGPGEAKGGLKKRLERHKLGGRIVGVKTMDKMTDNQIAAKVRLYFQKHGSRQQDRDRTIKQKEREPRRAALPI